MNEVIFIIIMIVFSLLTFLVDIVLLIRFIILIKQIFYKDYSLTIENQLLPNYFPKIKNKYIRLFFNYIVFYITIYIIAFYYPRRFHKLIFSLEYFWKSFVLTFIMLIVFSITRKMKFLNNKANKFSYLELILIPLMLISSIYYFNIFFEWFERYGENYV
ncbi:hypothetical protein HUW76_07260 [Fusobacterium animalis]|uniref:Uncharacterized protein n=1 Tax=Fusobacterium animalis 4_8 TaxID=469607 RepID=R9RDC6_9FUSO|nr:MULTISPECIES: hypothetical protein [Fusobacterium]AGM23892.1 hypothetical protein HMPREF0409_02304 [Fusobacterium animalis 4_8]EEW95439.1 hypothetical protein HMPREF0406_00861 [Fusobacterium animalis 3_1_33]MCG6844018.1 hypothetical protein [Fusobacterium nucleatum]